MAGGYADVPAFRNPGGALIIEAVSLASAPVPPALPAQSSNTFVCRASR